MRGEGGGRREEGEWAVGGCLPQTLQQQGQGTLSPAGLHDPLSHGSWGQLQAPSYSWFLNSRTRSRACYLRSTQTPGRNHVCSPQQGRVAGSPSGRDPNLRSSLTRQGTPWRPPDKDSERRDGPGPPQRNVAAAPTPRGCARSSGLWGLKPLVVFTSLHLWVQVNLAPLHVLMLMDQRVGCSLPSLPLGACWGDQAA